jgi:hypothetical protein
MTAHQPRSPADTPRDSNDPRRLPRAAAAASIKIVVQDHGVVTPPQLVRIHDISPEGIGFTCRSRLRPGDEFFLITGGDITRPKRYLYTVRHAREIVDGDFLVGAELTRILKDYRVRD